MRGSTRQRNAALLSAIEGSAWFTKATLAYIIVSVTHKIYAAAKMSSLPDRIEYPAAVITPAQIRAARALLGWKQTDLAEKSGVSEISIKNIERGVTDPRASTLQAIQDAFAKHKVEFLDPGQASLQGGAGVRLTKR